MSTAIALTPAQIVLKEKIEQLLDQLIQWNQHSSQEIESWLDELCGLAEDLHAQLKSEGQEPKHKAHIIARRGMKPDEKGFYRHMHAAESLLIFLEEGGFNPNKGS